MSEDRAREAVEHVQQAALEMIEAGRAFLDLAEQLVRDPAPLVAAATAAAEAASSFSRRGAPQDAGEPDSAERRGRASSSDSGAGPRVQHIRVS